MNAFWNSHWFEVKKSFCKNQAVIKRYRNVTQNDPNNTDMIIQTPKIK